MPTRGASWRKWCARRSHAAGAAKLLAEAALFDIDEARAAKQMQASASLGRGPATT